MQSFCVPRNLPKEAAMPHHTSVYQERRTRRPKDWQEVEVVAQSAIEHVRKHGQPPEDPTPITSAVRERQRLSTPRGRFYARKPTKAELEIDRRRHPWNHN
jgi:hypothetical protein